MQALPSHGRWVLALRPAWAKLNAGHTRPGCADETDNWRERLGVRIGPDAEVLRRDAALGRNGGGFRHHQSGAAHGAAAEVNKMPFIGQAVDAPNTRT